MKAFGLIVGITILLFVLAGLANGTSLDANWNASGWLIALGVVGVVILLSYGLIRIRGASWWPR